MTIPYLTLTAAANETGISTSTIDSAASAGKIDTAQTQGEPSARLYCPKSLKRWAKSRPGKGGRPKEN